MKKSQLLTLILLLPLLSSANESVPLQPVTVSPPVSVGPVSPATQPAAAPGLSVWHDGDLPPATADIKSNTFLIFDQSVPDETAREIHARLEGKGWKFSLDKDHAARSMTILATFRAFNDDMAKSRDTLEQPLSQVIALGSENALAAVKANEAPSISHGLFSNSKLIVDSAIDYGTTAKSLGQAVGPGAIIGGGVAVLVNWIANSISSHKPASTDSHYAPCTSDCDAKFHHYHNQVAYHLEFRENRKDFNETFDVVRFNVTAEQQTDSGMTKLPDGINGILPAATDELIKSL